MRANHPGYILKTVAQKLKRGEQNYCYTIHMSKGNGNISEYVKEHIDEMEPVWVTIKTRKIKRK